jgi:hypothetical protein
MKMKNRSRVFTGSSRIPQILLMSGLALAIVVAGTIYASANPTYWKLEWPDTDFSKSSVDFGPIMSGGPPKDGIRAAGGL